MQRQILVLTQTLLFGVLRPTGASQSPSKSTKQDTAVNPKHRMHMQSCCTHKHFSTLPRTLGGVGLPRQWSNRLWHFGICCISWLLNLAAGTSHFLVKCAKSLQCLVGNGLLERQ